MARPTRVLAVFAGVFTLGLLIQHNPVPVVFRLGVAGLFFGLALIAHHVPSLPSRWVTLLLLGFWFSLGWANHLLPAQHLPEGNVWLEGRIRVPVEQRESGTRLRLTLDHWEAGEWGGSLRLGAVVQLKKRASLQAGERIRLIGEMENLRPARNPGGFDARAYWGMRGVQVRIAHPGSLQRLGVQGSTARIERGLDRLRRHVEERIDSFCDPVTAPLATALMTGNRQEWDQPTRDRLARSGVMHLFAISGLHVGLLWMILRSLLLLLRIPSRINSVLLLFAIWFYVAFTGANPPVLRAAVILTLFTVGQLLQRQNRIGYALALAWIGLLAWRPAAIGDAGFQLTFAGALGSVWAGHLFKDWLVPGAPVRQSRALRETKRIGRQTLYGLMISLGATLLTAPIVIYHFGRLPWFGPIVTVIAVPLLSGILITGWGVVLLGGLPLVGSVLGDALWAQVHLLNLLAGAASGWLPVASFLPRSSAVLAALVALLLLVYGRRLKELRWQGASITLLVIATGIVWAEAWMPVGKVKLAVLDVGQGDAVLIRRGERAVLIDSGSGRMQVALNQLRLTGVRRVDLLILTHGDGDHAGGAAEIVENVPVGCAILGPGVIRDPAGKRAVEAMLEHHVPLLQGRAGSTMRAGDLGEFTLIGPPDEILDQSRVSDNDLSLVTLWKCHDVSAVFPGDAGQHVENNLLKKGKLPEVNLLMAGHHGSRYATGEDWLRVLQPETVVISAGWGNPYGHPAEDVLRRLSKFGISVHRTDLEGSILFEVRNDGIHSLSPGEWW